MKSSILSLWCHEIKHNFNQYIKGPKLFCNAIFRCWKILLHCVLPSWYLNLDASQAIRLCFYKELCLLKFCYHFTSRYLTASKICICCIPKPWYLLPPSYGLLGSILHHVSTTFPIHPLWQSWQGYVYMNHHMTRCMYRKCHWLYYCIINNIIQFVLNICTDTLSFMFNHITRQYK